MDPTEQCGKRDTGKQRQVTWKQLKASWVSWGRPLAKGEESLSRVEEFPAEASVRRDSRAAGVENCAMEFRDVEVGGQGWTGRGSS
jgi:hypothetical protein